MPDLSAAERYARALVELGQEEDQVERFLADLNTFGAVLDLADVDVLGTLSHPGFSLQERRGVLDGILARLDLHTHTANFLRITLDKRRFRILPAIIDCYTAAADRLAGRVRASVTTAFELSPELEKSITDALAAATGKTVHIDKKVDPLIIGGVIAEVEGRIYDASLRTRLVNLRQSLLSTNPEQAAEA